MPMTTLSQASTDALSDDFLAELRQLLDAAFDGDFSDDDWHHALGGVHVWVTDAHRVISHAAVVERTLVCAGRPLRVGYVEAVATVATHRRQGHGSMVMQRVGEIIAERFALGALSTSTHAFYERHGWQRWRGPTFVDGPRGPERTADEDAGILVLRTPRSPDLDLGADIVCDWRSGDVW
jgi:aminoglycoside 2'-N-acetyltransferase I